MQNKLKKILCLLTALVIMPAAALMVFAEEDDLDPAVNDAGYEPPTSASDIIDTEPVTTPEITTTTTTATTTQTTTVSTTSKTKKSKTKKTTTTTASYQYTDTSEYKNNIDQTNTAPPETSVEDEKSSVASATAITAQNSRTKGAMSLFQSVLLMVIIVLVIAMIVVVLWMRNKMIKQNDDFDDYDDYDDYADPNSGQGFNNEYYDNRGYDGQNNNGYNNTQNQNFQAEYEEPEIIYAEDTDDFDNFNPNGPRNYR